MRAMVIDHDLEMRERLADALVAAGFDVVTADPAATVALPAIVPQPDVYVFALVMPEKDGFEYLREIRASGIGATVLVYTRDGQGYGRFAEHLGATRAFECVTSADFRRIADTAGRCVRSFPELCAF